jgi:hypothetical protein
MLKYLETRGLAPKRPTHRGQGSLTQPRILRRTALALAILLFW